MFADVCIFFCLDNRGASCVVGWVLLEVFCERLVVLAMRPLFVIPSLQEFGNANPDIGYTQGM